MAEEIPIVGTNEIAKKRNPWGVLGLSLITLGIYHFVWWYKINKEMVELGRAKGTGEMGDNPTTSLLALVPGFLIIVPPLVSYYKGTQRMQAAARHTGAEPVNGWIALIIFVVIGIAFAPFLQSQLNKVWDAQAGGGAAAAIPAADAAALPAEPAAPAEQPPPPPAQ
jgi:membrane protease YdiL (CAAX protease family)